LVFLSKKKTQITPDKSLEYPPAGVRLNDFDNQKSVLLD